MKLLIVDDVKSFLDLERTFLSRADCRVYTASTGLEAIKVAQRERPDLILLAVTSQVRPGTGFGECPVGQWQKAGLLKPSVIKPVATTIEKNLVLRKLGRLHEEDRRALLELLQRILGEHQ